MNPRKLLAQRILIAASVISLTFLVIIFALFRYGDDSHWAITLLFSLPTFVFAVPCVILLAISALARSRAALGINALSLLVAAGPVMGFHWSRGPQLMKGLPVRVMTWNVEKWSHGPDAVARGIRTEHPDVVCLQEAGDYFYVQGAQGKGLMAALPNFHFVRSGEIMVGARWPLKKLAETPLPPGPDSRPALTVAVNENGREYLVTSVHLLPTGLGSHIRQAPQFAPRVAAGRRSQGEALLRGLDLLRKQNIADGGDAALICGDFNAQPQTSLVRHLTRTYPDAFESAGRGYGYTLPSTRPVNRIDHILTNPETYVERCEVPNIIASDHRPLVADVVLPPG